MLVRTAFLSVAEQLLLKQFPHAVCCVSEVMVCSVKC
jgi:hypothetical protein